MDKANQQRAVEFKQALEITVLAITVLAVTPALLLLHHFDMVHCNEYVTNDCYNIIATL